MMSLLAKLLCAKKNKEKKHVEKTTTPVIEANRRSSSPFQDDNVRILLIRECEWRGRKVLYDSMAFNRSKNTNVNTSFNEGNIPNKDFTNMLGGTSSEKEKLIGEDIGLLSEMIFGTVAMTYRGSSFKIHGMSSSSCLMCTKIFPAPERCNCRQSSNDLLTRSTNLESSSSNSSSSSLKAQNSGTNLRPSKRKDSTCSSTGSWEIEIPPRPTSIHSPESSSSSEIGGSLSSLRRRWMRSISTSLSQSDSDDVIGANENPEGRKCRHKTRLGLAMLLTTEGYEKKLEARLLEHAAIIENILDRLRCLCIDGRGSEKTVAARLHRMTSSFALRLLRVLMEPEYDNPTPLLWHDLLLNASVSVPVKIDTVHDSLQRMCQLLDNLDTKSTNFFLSTIVTAVLTYHLGWVHTAPAGGNRALLDKLDKKYPCNRLWAQLTDLYGALGTPTRVAHTVVVGDPEKANLIDAVLDFLSYFIRSGLVEKRTETRCTSQQDVREAIALLERAKRKNPTLFKKVPEHSPQTVPEPVRSKRKTSVRLDLPAEIPAKSDFGERISMLKPNTSTLQLNLGKDDFVDGEVEKLLEVQDLLKDHPQLPSPTWEVKKLEAEELDECFSDLKLEAIRRQKFAFEEFEQLQFSPGEKSQVTSSVVEEKPREKRAIGRRLTGVTCKCQCSFSFNRVPSTSADLPEGVLRKIIQRNFPESSKNMQPPECDEDFGICLKCSRGYGTRRFENAKLTLETPTNATDVLRTCGSTSTPKGTKPKRSNSLEALMEENCVIELPMPRSEKVAVRGLPRAPIGFTKTLIGNKATIVPESNQEVSDIYDSGYTWGMVVQGFTKRKKARKRDNAKKQEEKNDNDCWKVIREGIGCETRFPIVDQPVAEALCIFADLDNWQVGLLSNNSPWNSAPLPVGMSKLVSNMLEAFSYLWKTYRNPEQCIKLLESRLRELWMRSETLAELLKVVDLETEDFTKLTSVLDIDAADLPLLLAVASTHTQSIACKVGLALS